MSALSEIAVLSSIASSLAAFALTTLNIAYRCRYAQRRTRRKRARSRGHH